MHNQNRLVTPLRGPLGAHLLIPVPEGNGLGRHNRRDSVLIDELALGIPLQEDAKVIEPGDIALQFHTVNKEDRHGNPIFPDVVQENVLKILFFLIHFR